MSAEVRLFQSWLHPNWLRARTNHARAPMSGPKTILTGPFPQPVRVEILAMVKDCLAACDPNVFVAGHPCAGIKTRITGFKCFHLRGIAALGAGRFPLVLHENRPQQIDALAERRVRAAIYLIKSRKKIRMPVDQSTRIRYRLLRMPMSARFAWTKTDYGLKGIKQWRHSDFPPLRSLIRTALALARTLQTAALMS